jgi:hypothetical protein
MLHSSSIFSFGGPDLITVAPPLGNQLPAVLAVLYRKLTGKSGGGFPDPEHDKSWVILLVIIVWILAVVFLALIRSRLPFTMRVLGLMVLVCSAPIVSVELLSKNRAVRVVVESLIVSGSVALFSWNEFGSQYISKWILYTAAIVLVLEVGSHLVEWNKDDSIRRLSQWSDLLDFLKHDTFVIDRVFRRQQITYLAIPLGFLLGLQVGLMLGYSNGETVAVCLIAILSLASIFLLYFLINSFVKMIDPIFTPGNVGTPVVTPVVPANNVKEFLAGMKLLIVVPSAVENKDESRDLNLASAVTNLRKIYLFDSLHNVVLLIAFVGVMLNFFTVNVSETPIIVSLLAGTLISCQLPFSIGQARMHRKVLWRLRGTEEVEVSKKLGKVAPRFPAFQFLTTLFTTGGGSFLYFLLDEVIKNRLKLLAGLGG